MDGGAWWAAVHEVAKSRTRLSDFTFTFHFHALEKEMATHSSVLAWRIPGTGEPDGLLSVGSHRVGHDWSDLAAAAVHWRIFQRPSFWFGCSYLFYSCYCCYSSAVYWILNLLFSFWLFLCIWSIVHFLNSWVRDFLSLRSCKWYLNVSCVLKNVLSPLGWCYKVLPTSQVIISNLWIILFEYFLWLLIICLFYQSLRW